MKLKLQHRTEAASTLTEVVAAIAILAISTAGLMGALANGFFSMQLARENQRATQILIEQAEMIRLYNWDQINTPGFIPGQFTALYDPQNGSGVTYTGRVAITAVPFAANYATNMRQLTLTLNWVTRQVPRSRTVTTFVSQDGVQNYV